MKNTFRKAEDEVVREIASLFDKTDEFLLVTSNHCLPAFVGLHMLRLVGNCVFDDVYGDWRNSETKLASTTFGKPERGTVNRLATIKKEIERKRKEPGAHFVVCYHLKGTAEWNLAWSEGISRSEAIKMLLESLEGDDAITEADTVLDGCVDPMASVEG